jgi:DNA primase
VGQDVERIKRELPLLEYLQQQKWTGQRAGRFEYVGLCPLHEETRPSFYVNTRKDVFYCHGCGQGGDLIRFVQLSRQLSFRQSLAYLDPQAVQEAESTGLLEQTATFYQQQLDHYPEALSYLRRRGIDESAPPHTSTSPCATRMRRALSARSNPPNRKVAGSPNETETIGCVKSRSFLS